MLNPNWTTWIKKRVLLFILWALLTVWTASFTTFNAISFKRVAFSVLQTRMWKLQIPWTSNLMKPNALYYFFRQQWKICNHELYLLEQHSRLNWNSISWMLPLLACNTCLPHFTKRQRENCFHHKETLACWSDVEHELVGQLQRNVRCLRLLYLILGCCGYANGSSNVSGSSTVWGMCFYIRSSAQTASRCLSTSYLPFVTHESVTHSNAV